MKGIKQIKDYRLLKELGRGANGIVYEAIEDKTNKFVAIKAIPNDKLNNPRLMEQFKKELKTLYRLSHKNIIKIVGVEKTINNIYLILEYCNGGTLYDYSQHYKKTNKSRLPELIVQKVIKQVIEGLKFMHKNNIIHRDIKLENILINFDDQPNIYSENSLINKGSKELYNVYDLEKNNFTIKIADLGYARELEGGLGASTICGTPMTIAPEIVNIFSNNGRDSKYNSAIDLWSLGAVLYELLMGVSPFVGGSKEDIMRKVFSGMYEIPSNVSVSIESIYLLNGLLQFYPQKRLSWDQIVFHPFITKDVKKFKFIKLNSVINSNNNNINNDCINQDKFLINSKDCSNFLWILFKATGASLPFELDELDKDTYEEVIKDVIANQMFIDPEDNKEELNNYYENDNNNNNNNNNKNNNNNNNYKNEAAYLNNQNDYLKIKESYNFDINNVKNIANKEIKKEEIVQEKINENFPNVNIDNGQKILNNESNFYLFKDASDNIKKEKEEEKVILVRKIQEEVKDKNNSYKEIKEDELRLKNVEFVDIENIAEKDNKEDKENLEKIINNFADICVNNRNISLKDKIENIEDDLKQEPYENKEKLDNDSGNIGCNNIENAKYIEEDKLVIKYDSAILRNNNENVKEEDKKDFDNELKNDTKIENYNNNTLLKEKEINNAIHFKNEIEVFSEKEDINASKSNENEKVYNKLLLLDRTIKLNDIYYNAEIKNKYINGSIDSQFSKESLGSENIKNAASSYHIENNVGRYSSTKFYSPGDFMIKDPSVIVESESKKDAEILLKEEKIVSNESKIEEKNKEIQEIKNNNEIISFRASNNNPNNENPIEEINKEIKVESHNSDNENEFDEDFTNYIVVGEEDLKDRCVQADKFDEDYEMIDNYFN